jgi:hypothetical protein
MSAYIDKHNDMHKSGPISVKWKNHIVTGMHATQEAARFKAAVPASPIPFLHWSLIGFRGAMAEPTVLDSHGDSQDIAACPGGSQNGPEDQEGLPEPASKRTKKMMNPAFLGEVLPKQFMAKWISTEKGILPFVKNLDTDVVHCGFTRMKVLHFKSDSGTDDYRSVVCMSGCAVECQKEGTEECDCVCHLLQKDYDSRPH